MSAIHVLIWETRPSGSVPVVTRARQPSGVSCLISQGLKENQLAMQSAHYDECHQYQHLVFMVTHGPAALYPISDDVIIVWLSSQQPPSRSRHRIILASDFFPDATERHRRLSGGLGCQVIFRYLESLERKPDRITICAYRKFVSHVPFGEPAINFRQIPASNYYGMRILTPEGKNQPSVFPAGLGAEFCISPVRKFTNIVTQFAGAHSLDDFLLLTSACIRSGSMSGSDIAELISMCEFVPGGLELGTYPYPFWRDSVEKVIASVDFFLMNHRASDDLDIQQSRAISFGTERLGSFFLLRHIATRAAERRSIKNPFGNIHTVLATTPPRRTGASLALRRLRLGLDVAFRIKTR